MDRDVLDLVIVLVGLATVLINLLLYGLSLKLYTEWWKERVKTK